MRGCILILRNYYSLVFLLAPSFPILRTLLAYQRRQASKQANTAQLKEKNDQTENSDGGATRDPQRKARNERGKEGRRRRRRRCPYTYIMNAVHGNHTTKPSSQLCPELSFSGPSSSNSSLLLSATVATRMHFTADRHKNSHLVTGGKFFFVYFHPSRSEFPHTTDSTYRFSMVSFGLLLRP